MQKRYSVLVAFVVVVSLSATPALAGQAEESVNIGQGRHYAGERSFRPVVSLLALSSEQAASGDQQQWAQELARTRSRLRRSKWLLIGGGALIGLGVLITAREKETGYDYVTGPGIGTDIAAYGLGGGLVVYGLIERSRAEGRRTRLMEEGRQKGFTASVTAHAVQIGYAVGF